MIKTSILYHHGDHTHYIITEWIVREVGRDMIIYISERGIKSIMFLRYRHCINKTQTNKKTNKKMLFCSSQAHAHQEYGANYLRKLTLEFQVRNIYEGVNEW